MKILTGNDLKTGAVVWWDGQGWSIHVEDAADVGDQAEAILAARGRRAAASTAAMRSTPSPIRRAACARRTSRTASAPTARPCAPT